MAFCPTGSVEYMGCTGGGLELRDKWWVAGNVDAILGELRPVAMAELRGHRAGGGEQRKLEDWERLWRRT